MDFRVFKVEPCHVYGSATCQCEYDGEDLEFKKKVACNCRKYKVCANKYDFFFLICPRQSRPCDEKCHKANIPELGGEFLSRQGGRILNGARL